MTRGILIIACGDVEAFARLCVESCKRQTKLPVHLHLDPTKPGIKSRAVKLRMDEISPFDATLYLDCDTVVAADPTPLFDLLQYAPLWMTPDVGPKTVTEMLAHRFFQTVLHAAPKLALERLAKVRPDAPHFNSGVILFDRRSAGFFQQWRDIWHRFSPGQDQTALTLLLGYHPELWPAVLSPAWNFQHNVHRDEKDLTAQRDQVRILHLLGNQKPELYRRARSAGYL